MRSSWCRLSYLLCLIFLDVLRVLMIVVGIIFIILSILDNIVLLIVRDDCIMFFVMLDVSRFCVKYVCLMKDKFEWVEFFCFWVIVDVMLLSFLIIVLIEILSFLVILRWWCLKMIMKCWLLYELGWIRIGVVWLDFLIVCLSFWYFLFLFDSWLVMNDIFSSCGFSFMMILFFMSFLVFLVRFLIDCIIVFVVFVIVYLGFMGDLLVDIDVILSFVNGLLCVMIEF